MVHGSGMRWKVKHSPDFKGLDEDGALKDLMRRIGHYEKVYETVTEPEGAYIKIFDLRAKVHACNVFGRMATKVLPYLIGMHSVPRPVFLLSVRPGQGAQSPQDVEHVRLACAWIATLGSALQKRLTIFCSRSPRAKEMAHALAEVAGCEPPRVRVALNPFDPAMEASPVATRRALGREAQEAQHPEHQSHPESLMKTATSPNVVLASRLEPVAMELESSTSPCLVVSHDAPCGSLRALFLALDTVRADDEYTAGGGDSQNAFLNAMKISEGDIRLSEAAGAGSSTSGVLATTSLMAGGSLNLGSTGKFEMKYEQNAGGGNGHAAPASLSVVHLQPKDRGGYSETVLPLPPAVEAS